MDRATHAAGVVVMTGAMAALCFAWWKTAAALIAAFALYSLPALAVFGGATIVASVAAAAVCGLLWTEMLRNPWVGAATLAALTLLAALTWLPALALLADAAEGATTHFHRSGKW